jgi:hypothetical protein
MPAIGRLLAALTGVVPQKTVNPDGGAASQPRVHAANPMEWMRRGDRPSGLQARAFSEQSQSSKV